MTKDSVREELLRKTESLLIDMTRGFPDLRDERNRLPDYLGDTKRFTLEVSQSGAIEMLEVLDAIAAAITQEGERE